MMIPQVQKPISQLDVQTCLRLQVVLVTIHSRIKGGLDASRTEIIFCEANIWLQMKIFCLMSLLASCESLLPYYQRKIPVANQGLL